jgi:hypothetical protein
MSPLSRYLPLHHKIDEVQRPGNFGEKTRPAKRKYAIAKATDGLGTSPPNLFPRFPREQSPIRQSLFWLSEYS